MAFPWRNAIRDASPSIARVAGLSVVLGSALTAITALAPGLALADNGGSFVDMWPAIDIAVFAGMATPFIFWAAKRFPPPGPPPPPPGPDPDYNPPPGPPPPPPPME